MNDELTHVWVEPDSFQVSCEPVLLVADLKGALAVCLHDEHRGAGGVLHLRFSGESGRPNEVTDDALSAVLAVVDHFTTAVLGAAPRPLSKGQPGPAAQMGEIQARILAQAPPRGDSPEPKVSLVDLICADFKDRKIACGTQTLRRVEPVRVFFQPAAGRVWISGPSPLRASQKKRSSIA